MSSPSHKRVALEILLVMALVFATIWVAPLLSRDRATARRIGYMFAALTMAVTIASNVHHGDSLQGVGLRLDNFLRALRLLALPTILLAGVLLLMGFSFGSLHFGRRLFVFRFSRVILPVAQQYLLQGFLNRRLRDWRGPGRASQWPAAVIFALLHLPNPALMIATFIGGLMWTRAFQREPNLFALVLSHLVLSTVLGHTLPPSILPNLKIGWAY